MLGGWRERVFSDITYGEEQLTFRVRGYRPLAFAPPYGNYGQAGTNDQRIPRELLARLLQSFEVVFTRDRSGPAFPGAPNPLGRIEMTRDVTEGELHMMLLSAPRKWARSRADGAGASTRPGSAASSTSSVSGHVEPGRRLTRPA